MDMSSPRSPLLFTPTQAILIHRVDCVERQLVHTGVLGPSAPHSDVCKRAAPPPSLPQFHLAQLASARCLVQRRAKLGTRAGQPADGSMQSKTRLRLYGCREDADVADTMSLSQMSSRKSYRSYRHTAVRIALVEVGHAELNSIYIHQSRTIHAPQELIYHRGGNPGGRLLCSPLRVVPPPTVRRNQPRRLLPDSSKSNSSSEPLLDTDLALPELIELLHVWTVDAVEFTPPQKMCRRGLTVEVLGGP